MANSSECIILKREIISLAFASLFAFRIGDSSLAWIRIRFHFDVRLVESRKPISSVSHRIST